jgi:hypothetical protein
MREDMLHDEEEDINWLEVQLQDIGQMGLQNYLAQQLKKTADSAIPGAIVAGKQPCPPRSSRTISSRST